MKPKMIMRAVVALLVAGFCLFSVEGLLAQSKDASSRIYELRTYTTLPGRLPALNKRFADLSHDSQEAADKNWKEFQMDPEWVQVRDASESDGKILAKPPERVFMKMTDYSPGK